MTFDGRLVAQGRMITFSPFDAIAVLGLAAKAIPFGAERLRDKAKRDRIKGHMVRAISSTPVGLRHTHGVKRTRT